MMTTTFKIGFLSPFPKIKLFAYLFGLGHEPSLNSSMRRFRKRNLGNTYKARENMSVHISISIKEGKDAPYYGLPIPGILCS